MRLLIATQPLAMATVASRRKKVITFVLANKRLHSKELKFSLQIFFVKLMGINPDAPSCLGLRAFFKNPASENDF